MSADPGRDELIDARAERDRLKAAAMSAARSIAVLMEDRVRHITALRQVAMLANTGYTVTGQQFREIAVKALETKSDMSWWPDEYCDRSWHDGDCCEGSRRDYAAKPGTITKAAQ